jgi:hypothetical protein
MCASSTSIQYNNTIFVQSSDGRLKRQLRRTSTAIPERLVRQAGDGLPTHVHGAADIPLQRGVNEAHGNLLVTVPRFGARTSNEARTETAGR